MTTTQDLTTATPVEIDTELARIWGEIEDAAHRVRTINGDLARTYTWGRKLGELVHTGADREHLEAKLDEAKAAVVALRTEASPYEAEYASRPWNRYFLVKNSNGHVHRGMDCNTCFPTTTYAWIIDLADCDEALMVEEYGESACTVCFPDAPALPAYNTPGRRNQAERDAKAAEKAAKAAAKAAKLLNERVRGEHNSSIETIASAKQEIRDNILWATYYPDSADRYAESVSRMVEALLATGRVEQAEIDQIIERATKKALKEAGGR